MIALDLVGHAAYALIALGMGLLACGVRWGWAFRFLGEAGWVGIGFALGMTSIWSWGIWFLLIDAAGFWWWSRGRAETGISSDASAAPQSA